MSKGDARPVWAPKGLLRGEEVLLGGCCLESVQEDSEWSEDEGGEEVGLLLPKEKSFPLSHTDTHSLVTCSQPLPPRGG